MLAPENVYVDRLLCLTYTFDAMSYRRLFWKWICWKDSEVHIYISEKSTKAGGVFC